MSQLAKTRILWLMLSVVAWAGIEYPLPHPWASTSVPHQVRRGGAQDDNIFSPEPALPTIGHAVNSRKGRDQRRSLPLQPMNWRLFW